MGEGVTNCRFWMRMKESMVVVVVLFEEVERG